MFSSRQMFYAMSSPISANLILVYDTSKEATRQVSLPLFGTVNVSVNWGDGNTNTYTTPGIKTYTYSANANYTVNISGSLERFGNRDTAVPNIAKLTQIVNFGNVGLQSLSGALHLANNITSVPNSLPSTVQDLSYFSYLNSANNSAFANVVNWNTANVNNLALTWTEAYNFNQAIGGWNTSNVSNMYQMFALANSFNQPLNSWNVSNVSNMAGMFTGVNMIFNQDLNSWNTINVTNMSGMFGSSNNAFNGNIAAWNTSNVTNMSDMFFGASNFNQPIGNWKTGNVTNMNSMFRSATVFNQNLTNWCVTNIPSEPANFALNSALTANNKPVWGTCPP